MAALPAARRRDRPFADSTDVLSEQRVFRTYEALLDRWASVP